MTEPLERVLGAFLADPAEPRYGYDLMKAARLPSGTLYPLLARLEQQKLVTSAWETPQQEGQRPRKYYQLTGEGIRIARLELAQTSSPSARTSPPWPPRTREPGVRGERQLLRSANTWWAGPQRLPRASGRSGTGNGPPSCRDPARSPDRPTPRRAVRMLAYAADTLRGAIRTPARARRGHPALPRRPSCSLSLAWWPWP